MKQTPQIMPEGKIDIHNSSDNLDTALTKLAGDDVILDVNRTLIQRFIRDCRLGKTVIGRSKKRIGPATCLKYLSNFKILCREIPKPFDDITQEDMDSFIERLQSDSIRSQKNVPYSEETKAGLKKAIRKFWKWKDGGNKQYPELVEWIETYSPIKEIPALSRTEVDRLIEYCSNPRDRALLMSLFDSGARIEELLNVRLKPEHLFWKESTGCYMIRLEFSKTKPRTISLPLSTSHLKKWLENHPLKGSGQAQLFPMSYPAVRMLITRLGKRVLNRKVTPHILRHSSATYYANRLRNRYQLCYRYGWTMSSNMVDRYLDREGILEDDTAVTIKSEETANLSKQNRTLEEDLILLKEAHTMLTTQFDGMKGELEALRSGKGILKLFAELLRKEPTLSATLGHASKQGFDLVLDSGQRATL